MLNWLHVREWPRCFDTILRSWTLLPHTAANSCAVIPTERYSSVLEKAPRGLALFGGANEDEAGRHCYADL